MKVALAIIVIFALCAIKINANICLERENMTAGEQFFCSVAIYKRNNLVIHYLSDALISNGYLLNPDRRVENPWQYFGGNPPENFAQNLLKWVVDRTNKTSDELAVLIPTADPATNRVVCVDECFDGTCEPWDAGCHCCPFN